MLWNRKGKKKTKQKKGMFHVEQFSQKGNNQGVKTLPSVTRIIAIANQKGGVAKTTTAVNLSACLTAWDRKVLLVDIDPQGNATSGLGVDRDNLTSSIYDLLLGEREIEGVIVDTGIENLDLVPANISLAGAEIEMVGMEKRETKLRDCLMPIKDRYHYIFIDCPPSLGLLTINALTTASSVLIPIQCEYYALEGLSLLMKTVELVKGHLNPKLEIFGAVLTMFDARTNLSIEVVDEVKGFFKDKVFTTIISRNVRLSEAPSYGLPIILYDPKSKGAEQYMDLAKEVLERE